jgi:signal transduction histidine kinase/BarA-like signal transduction histidine kinase
MELPVWKILCVDRTPSESDMTKLLLEKMFFLQRQLRVVKAISTRNAEKVLQETHDIAVILIDMEEDKAQGLEFIRNVRELYRNPKVRIILRTGYPDTLPSRQEIESYTIDGYIPKEIISERQIEIAVMTAIRAHHQIITTETQLSDLAASIAHEMRNPLAQIRGNLYLIEELQKQIPYQYGAKPIVAHHIDNAKRVIQSGLQVIDITMDAIKDRPVNTENFQLVCARALVEEAIGDYVYEDPEHAELVLVAGEDFALMAEPVMVKYVLYNLLQNALWHIKSLPDTKIIISLQSSNRGFNQIEVRDTGPGIAAEAIPRLFDSFYTAGKRGGTGLGLAYCKRTMIALGGDISCASEVDHYTAFTLLFPKVSSAEAVDTQQPSTNVYQLPVATQATLSNQTPLSGRTLLIVEDDSVCRSVVRTMVEKQGMHCLEAENGQLALDVLSTQHCDLILTDMRMPVMDGLALIRALKAQPSLSKIPIIGLSSEDSEMMRTALQLGASGWLQKPISADRLLTKLQQLLPA